MDKQARVPLGFVLLGFLCGVLAGLLAVVLVCEGHGGPDAALFCAVDLLIFAVPPGSIVGTAAGWFVGRTIKMPFAAILGGAAGGALAPLPFTASLK